MKHRFVALLFAALLALVPACGEVSGEGGEGEGGGGGEEQEEGGGEGY